MNSHSIVNLKCPCFLFRYPKLDIPSQALFNLHRASALPLGCGSEDDQNFQNPTGHSRLPVTRRRYTMVSVCQGASLGQDTKFSNASWSILGLKSCCPFSPSLSVVTNTAHLDIVCTPPLEKLFITGTHYSK
jgi:hypothetical protein